MKDFFTWVIFIVAVVVLNVFGNLVYFQFVLEKQVRSQVERLPTHVRLKAFAAEKRKACQEKGEENE